MSHRSIAVFNRSEAEAFRSDVPYVIVGATDPDQPFPTYVESAACRRVLRLRFNDIPHQCCSRHQLFSEDHVALIVAFAHWLRESDVEQVVVHCEAGISRSSAIALSLAKFLDADTSGILNPAKRHRPNPFVYWRLARALMPGRQGTLLDEFYQWNADHADELRHSGIGCSREDE